MTLNITSTNRQGKQPVTCTAKRCLIALFVAITLIVTPLCAHSDQQTEYRIAFLSDIHLHDVFAEVHPLKADGATAQTGISLPVDEKTDSKLLMRSMSAQLSSTRLFNENYFVLRAALDELAKRDIKLVALPGDFTDDGQPINVDAVARILDEYTKRYDMQFFTITGNHDPVRPFLRPGGKADFLSANGQEFGLYSVAHQRCQNPQITESACAHEMDYLGYKGIMQRLSKHGFYPQAHYVYYETPFSHPEVESGSQTWDFELSSAQNTFEKRRLEWCSDQQNSKCFSMPDASYLVEPVEGLWLLAIDANVYAPIIESNTNNTKTKQAFKGSSSAGYNAMRIYKPKVLAWIADVVARAEAQNKQLVAFSHFPMTDFYDNAGADIQALFGEGAFQMARMPTQSTQNALAETGLRLHFAGHMHINDTGSVSTSESNTLYNIQVPSLAAYQPAYKILKLTTEYADVETLIVEQVPDFDSLFKHYQKEWEYRDQNKLSNWNKQILDVASYQAFTDEHLKAVVSNRYVPQEWPDDLVSLLKTHSLEQLHEKIVCESSSRAADRRFENTSAEEMIFDFYRIRNAADIASVSPKRLQYYLALAQYAEQATCPATNTPESTQLKQLLRILAKMINDQPSANFRIDWHKDTLIETSLVEH